MRPADPGTRFSSAISARLAGLPQRAIAPTRGWIAATQDSPGRGSPRDGCRSLRRAFAVTGTPMPARPVVATPSPMRTYYHCRCCSGCACRRGGLRKAGVGPFVAICPFAGGKFEGQSKLGRVSRSGQAAQMAHGPVSHLPRQCVDEGGHRTEQNIPVRRFEGYQSPRSAALSPVHAAWSRTTPGRDIWRPLWRAAHPAGTGLARQVPTLAVGPTGGKRVGPGRCGDGPAAR